MNNNPEYLNHLRHTAAHLLAAAVIDLYPNVKLTLGPAIDNGFYYDIDFGDVVFSEDELKPVEKRMKLLVVEKKLLYIHVGNLQIFVVGGM